MSEDSAAERKRKRLEAWRKRQQQASPAAATVAAPAPAVKISLSLATSKLPAAKRKQPAADTGASKQKKKKKSLNPFGDVDDDDDASEDEASKRKGMLKLGLGFNLNGGDEDDNKESAKEEPPVKRRKKGRWDNRKEEKETPENGTPQAGDALDKFMEKLEAGALGNVATQLDKKDGDDNMLNIDVGGSMMRLPKLKKGPKLEPESGGVITSEELAKLTPSSSKRESANKKANPDALYTQSDWESDNQAGGTSEVSYVCTMTMSSLAFGIDWLLCKTEILTQKTN
jgi:hypothetical protein